MTVSLIIACFERANELARLLSSLEKMDFREPWEIIVVDDGSKDSQAIKGVAEKFQCSLIRLDKNLGPANARNIGAKKAEGEFLWFLDSDSEAANRDLLANLVRYLKQNESLAGAGGEAAKINGRFYSNSLHPLPNWLPLTKYMPLDKPFQLHPKFVSTNNLLVSKKDFFRVGGFNPYFDMAEDQDLCLRLARLKKSFLIRHDTCAIHYHSPSGREGGKFWFFDNMWNYTLNMHKGRVKMLATHFPRRLLILPLLDAVFAPVVFISQMFFTKRRSTDLLKEKSKSSSKSFPIFIFFNAAALFFAWLFAAKFLIRRK